MSSQKAPEFIFPEIGFADLNKVSKAAFREISVDGGDVNYSGSDQVRITIPRIPERLIVRVVVEESGSGFSAGSGYDPADKTAYSWVEQVPQRRGRWADAEWGVTGDVDTNPLYEANGIEVLDGTVIEIIPTIGYFDTTVTPNVWIQEWVCWAGNALAESSGSGVDGTMLFDVACNDDGTVDVTRTG